MKSLENHLNIDLTALEHNLKEIKKKIFPSKVMAVVKSNAYGHGMLAVAKRLEKKVAYFFDPANSYLAVERNLILDYQHIIFKNDAPRRKKPMRTISK